MDKKVELLLNKFKDDVIMIDALYQWASNPTAKTAFTNRHYQYHYEINSNIQKRYLLDNEKATEVRNKLIEEIGNAGLDYRGHTEISEQIEERINEAYGDVLRKNVLERIKDASEEEKYMVWLYCKTKLWTHQYSDSDGRISANFKATFDIEISHNPIELLIKIGLINKLNYISSSGNSRDEYQLPQYLATLISEIDNYISLPELPDYKKYIDALFDKRIFNPIILLNELLPTGYFRQINELHGEIIPHPFIIVKSGNCVAINLRIYESFKEYFLERKAKEIKTMQEIIDKSITHLYDNHYPSLSKEPKEESEMFGASSLWLINTYDKSLAETEVLIILAPYLTGKELEHLKANYSQKIVVIILTLMSIPDLCQLYKAIYFAPLSESKLHWTILDFYKEKLNELVINDKPLLVNELCQVIKEKLNIPSKSTSPVLSVESEKKIEPSIESETKEKKDRSTALPINVFLGHSLDNTRIFWQPGRLNNGHSIIIGGSGAGKTETIRCIASELDNQGYPVLMIDFHGDMGCESSNMVTYTIKEGCEYYFNPLELNQKFKDITPLRATSDFVDSMSINCPTLGIQQRHVLQEIIKNAYSNTGITREIETWNKELDFMKIENEIKSNENNTIHALNAYFSKIFNYGIFSGNKKISMGEILKGGITHLNLNPLPKSLRALYADLFLRKLYYSLQALEGIPHDNIMDKDKFRIFVIVDEAKLLVSEKQGVKAVLNEYATEMRKFGVGLILASQLISHFTDEILSNIAVKLCMKAENSEQARKNNKFFGVSEKEIIDLGQGEGILIIGEEKVKLKIVPTWEREKE